MTLQAARIRGLFLLAAVAVTCSSLAQGQANMTKVIVPFPAGGVTDQAARIVTEQIARDLGQTIVVENRPGAGSRLGIDAVVKAPADGSTLLFTNSSYSILPIVDPSAGFDPNKALAPVSMAATYGLMIVTRKDLPVSTLAEFASYAKKSPGKLSYGSAGIGSGSHFAGEYFKFLTGTFMVHIPYKSTSAALNDVAGGLIDLAFDASAKPLVDAGRVKLLAVTGKKRDPRTPSAPTVAEAGFKDFTIESWVGLLAPPATPQAVLERWNQATNAALQNAGVQKRLAELGLQTQGGPAARLAAAVRDEQTWHRRVAAEAKLKFD